MELFKDILNRLQMYGNGYSMCWTTTTSLTGKVDNFVLGGKISKTRIIPSHCVYL